VDLPSHSGREHSRAHDMPQLAAAFVVTSQ
jgi:hypothetical protein